MIARTWVGWWALLSLGAGALACRSGDLPAMTVPSTRTSAGLERCSDLSGSYRFESLAASCRRKGSLSQFPLYPIEVDGRLRGPRDRGDFLPLPLVHWADRDSVVTLRQERCSALTLSLRPHAGPPSPYAVVELPAGELRQHGSLQWDDGGMRFESSGDWQGWQLPLGISRQREAWSLALDGEHDLVYTYSARETSAILGIVPWRRRLEVRCLLPGVPAPLP
jgi:hypothetical protein